ncbi:hypothetical protein SDC9_20840 [bioreactor metagenome]|uniref:EAL domain-containing protein n=1 Tax=bioreactor metagenome TaxID=1076179 RepID=A0A644U7U9_9ZZZZ|nr:EAL domain-containing protein [Negativicutes bacterium]
MKKRYEEKESVNFTRELLIGLGETSVRKNYYPELQKRMAELERFRILLDEIHDSIFLIELPSMHVVDMNTTARLCLGLSSDLADEVDITNLFSLNLSKHLTDFHESLTLECFFYCEKDTLPVEVTINKTPLQNQDYAIIIAHDITARRRSEEQLQATHEELHASYEELEALYGHLSAAEQALQIKVSELEQNHQFLQESEARYRLAMEGSNDAIWDWDLINDSLTISSHGYDSLGVTDETRRSHNAFWRSHIHPDDLSIREHALAQHFTMQAPHYEAEYRFSPAPGTWVWILAKGKALFDDQGKPIRISGSLTDITERKTYEQQLQNLAYHDILTGLPNRACFYEYLDKFIAQCERNRGCGALFLLDIDNFKLVNDALGHTAGDELLKKIGSRLKNLNLDQAIIARLSGDEFVLLLPEIGLPELEIWAKRILSLFDRPIAVSGTNLAISCSIGVSPISSGSLSRSDILRYADTALHQAKAAGKKSFRLYKPEMQEAVTHRIQLETELRQALAANHLVMYYQPQLDLASNRITAFEALLRWKHPEKGLIPPLSFIPLAEETGLIIPIGEFALRSACQFGRQLNKSQSNPVRVSVNISARQLMQDDFAATVTRIIAEEDYPPELLELEITESVLIESFAANVQKIKLLQAKGIIISLDDFGSGYSSLTYLRQLPIHTIKLDKDFIQNVEKDPTTHSIVRAVLSLAYDLNLSVIAEGVETLEQLEALRLLNCSYIQGYFISRPIPAEEALSFCLKQSLLDSET